MTGNDQQPTGHPPAATYRSGGPQQVAGYPVTGYPQGGAYQQGAGQQGAYQQGAYQESAGNPPAGYGSGRTASGPAAAWTPSDAQHDTGPVPVIRRSATRTLDPARLLGLIVAALGALNFVWGFLPEISLGRSDESLSVFAVGPAYVPVLLLIAGLLAFAAFLPGSEVSRLAVAAVSVGGAAGAIVSLGTESSVQIAFGSQASKGMGAILLVVFGIIQAVVAIGAYVVGADVPPWLRGGGASSAASSAGFAASAGSARSAGSSSGRSAFPGASGNPFGSSDQQVRQAEQAGSWSSGRGGGHGGPSAPAAWGVPSATPGAPGSSAGFAAAGYQPPPATNWSADEPATGPQFVVGTEKDSEPRAGVVDSPTTADEGAAEETGPAGSASAEAAAEGASSVGASSVGAPSVGASSVGAPPAGRASDGQPATSDAERPRPQGSAQD